MNESSRNIPHLYELVSETKAHNTLLHSQRIQSYWNCILLSLPIQNTGFKKDINAYSQKWLPGAFFVQVPYLLFQEVWAPNIKIQKYGPWKLAAENIWWESLIFKMLIFVNFRVSTIKNTFIELQTPYSDVAKIRINE